MRAMAASWLGTAIRASREVVPGPGSHLMAHRALRQLHAPSLEVSRMASTTIRPKRRGSTGEHERCWPRKSPRDLPSPAPVGPVTRNWRPRPLNLLGSPCVLASSAADF